MFHKKLNIRKKVIIFSVGLYHFCIQNFHIFSWIKTNCAVVFYFDHREPFIIFFFYRNLNENSNISVFRCNTIQTNQNKNINDTDSKHNLKNRIHGVKLKQILIYFSLTSGKQHRPNSIHPQSTYHNYSIHPQSTYHSVNFFNYSNRVKINKKLVQLKKCLRPSTEIIPLQETE